MIFRYSNIIIMGKCCYRFRHYALTTLCLTWLITLMMLKLQGSTHLEQGHLWSFDGGSHNINTNGSTDSDFQKAINPDVKIQQLQQKIHGNMSQSKQSKNHNDTIIHHECSELSKEDKKLFPHCPGKMDWMRQLWKSDTCYAFFGVDGSDCSIRKYLSEVENWCPLLPGRSRRKPHVNFNNSTNRITQTAQFNFDVGSLLLKLVNPGRRPNYNWIRQHVEHMWPKWESVGKALQNKHDGYFKAPRRKMRIFVYLGLLSQKSHMQIAENSQKGGPLGELKQWSDILCTLHLLGHELTIASEYQQLSKLAQSNLCDTASIYTHKDILTYDIIYTDIVGLRQISIKHRRIYPQIKCIVRIIDSFGTEPEFNHKAYAQKHGKSTIWGKNDLNPQQIYTMFPHTPDNSFMGFVIENGPGNNSSQPPMKRKNQALVYGKQLKYWSGKDQYLNVFHQYLDIHSTVFQKQGLPSYVHNHGVLSAKELQILLQESKFFIGLGFPYEGPAPLEAVAQGAVFINPKFVQPHSRRNQKFFRGKPTSRELTSQHPYMELFIGEPYVHTVDINDHTAVKNAIIKALSDIDNGKVAGFVPYEFTQEGMLQRVSAYLQKQNFCDKSSPPWPPKEDVTSLVSKPRQSCTDTCWEKGLICERSHFKFINNKQSLEKHFGSECKKIYQETDNIHYPGFIQESGQCYLQEDHLLFSCAGKESDLKRLCPCRTYIKGQTALCQKCL